MEGERAGCFSISASDLNRDKREQGISSCDLSLFNRFLLVRQSPPVSVSESVGERKGNVCVRSLMNNRLSLLMLHREIRFRSQAPITEEFEVKCCDPFTGRKDSVDEEGEEK